MRLLGKLTLRKAYSASEFGAIGQGVAGKCVSIQQETEIWFYCGFSPIMEILKMYQAFFLKGLACKNV